MIHRKLLALAAWGAVVNAAGAQTGLPTLDEALRISQQTGRPILAMAGQKT